MAIYEETQAATTPTACYTDGVSTTTGVTVALSTEYDDAGYTNAYDITIQAGVYCYQAFLQNVLLAWTVQTNDTSTYYAVEYMSMDGTNLDTCAVSTWADASATTYSNSRVLYTSIDESGSSTDPCGYNFRLEYTTAGIYETASFIILTNHATKGLDLLGAALSFATVGFL